MSFKKMNSILKSSLVIILLALLFSTCKSKNHESDDYEILSAILNSSFGNESDEENGLYWIDETKDYHSLLLLNHTKLIEPDLGMINIYLTFGDVSGFSINDFKKKHRWDIEKINDFNRYTLEVKTNQNIKTPYIGMVQISAISYNKNMDEAIVYTSFLCAGNGDCGVGLLFHLKKQGNWVVIKTNELWSAKKTTYNKTYKQYGVRAYLPAYRQDRKVCEIL